jgi:hypothetical protein
MNKYKIKINNTQLIRVHKTTAKKMFNNGEKLVICPNNLRPGFPWFPDATIDNKEETDFDKHINSFSYYNCINKETGYYIAYYKITS